MTAHGSPVYTTLDSPLGELLLFGEGKVLRGLYMQDGRKPGVVQPGWRREPNAFAEVESQLREYFAGARTSFDVPLEPAGTPFQLSVWRALQQIDYGHTLSYRDLATRVGRPNAARAVGAANGANPIAVIIPCHRLLGANGALTGYGGGIANKQALLELEAGRAYAGDSLWRRQVKPAIEPRISVGTIVSAR